MVNTVGELNQRWEYMLGIGSDNLALSAIYVTGWDRFGTLLLLIMQWAMLEKVLRG